MVQDRVDLRIGAHGLASAIISVAIVWFVGWMRRNG
jgi:hypothetical protein